MNYKHWNLKVQSVPQGFRISGRVRATALRPRLSAGFGQVSGSKICARYGGHYCGVGAGSLAFHNKCRCCIDLCVSAALARWSRTTTCWAIWCVGLALAASQACHGVTWSCLCCGRGLEAAHRHRRPNAVRSRCCDRSTAGCGNRATPHSISLGAYTAPRPRAEIRNRFLMMCGSRCGSPIGQLRFG